MRTLAYLVFEFVIDPLRERLSGRSWEAEDRRYRQAFLDLYEGD